jgi:hypothetical protein
MVGVVANGAHCPLHLVLVGLRRLFSEQVTMANASQSLSKRDFLDSASAGGHVS